MDKDYEALTASQKEVANRIGMLMSKDRLQMSPMEVVIVVLSELPDDAVTRVLQRIK